MNSGNNREKEWEEPGMSYCFPFSVPTHGGMRQRRDAHLYLAHADVVVHILFLPHNVMQKSTGAIVRPNPGEDGEERDEADRSTHSYVDT